MTKKNKVIVFDVDGTVAEIRKQGQQYSDLLPKKEIIKKIINLYDEGYYIIFYTSRQMNTYQGNVGLINANTLITLEKWLKKHRIPFNEIHIGKPWCGFDGFYVDDKSIRPSEFLNNSVEEILKIIGNEN